MRFLMISAFNAINAESDGERILKVNIWRSYGQESKWVFFF